MHVPPTDTVNGRQQAASRLNTIYSVVTSGLGRPPGARRAPPRPNPHAPSVCPFRLSPHACCPFPSVPSFSTSVFLSGIPHLPPASLLAQPVVGALDLPRLPAVLTPGRLCGHGDCTQTGAGFSSLSLALSLSFSFSSPPPLSLISGGPLWSLLYFIVLGGVFGGRGRRACPHGVCQYLQKLLPKSCLAAVVSPPNHPWVLGSWGRAEGAWLATPLSTLA
jgi:hypothetical protein